MTKKFSIHDWVYPDGDPIKAANERVLGSFCKPANGDIEEQPRYDLSIRFHPSVYASRIFLGWFGIKDLWLFDIKGSLGQEAGIQILRYDPSYSDGPDVIARYIHKPKPPFPADLAWNEAYNRAKARGLF